MRLVNDGHRPKPTSFDVAKRAGVSRSAVSRAFTPGAHIAEETRQRVLSAAADLGYRINALARGLQGRHSGIVGLVASRPDTAFRGRQVRLLAHGLIREGFWPMLVSAERPEDIRNLYDTLLSYNVAGLIVTSGAPPVEIIEDCRRTGLPMVLINRAETPDWGDRIVADIAESGQIACDVLRDSGARRLACLSSRRITWSVDGRARAFVAAARATGLPCRMILADTETYDDARRALSEPDAPALDEVDGLFCATDLLALGALDALRHDRGMNVPLDMQVLGFDDIEQASWASYDLSTIRQDVAEMCDLAIRILTERIARPGQKQRSFCLTLRPVLRGTTR